MSKSDWSGQVAVGLAGAALLATLALLTAYSFGLGNLKGYSAAETQHYQTEYADRTANRIEGCKRQSVAAEIAECVNKAVRDNHEQQRNERDLRAQSEMSERAFWALVIASISLFVTSVGTLFLAKQVQLTREAVEDTERATKAMIRQNELVEQAQRAWVAMTTTIDRITVEGDRLSIYYAVEFSNIGQTIATDVKTFVSGRVFGEDWRKVTVDRRNKWVLSNRAKGTGLMPGESFTLWGESNLSIEHIPWENTGDVQWASYVLNTVALYRVSGDSPDAPPRLSGRMFVVGYRHERPLMQLQLFRHMLKSAKAKQIVVTASGPSITT